MLGPFLQHDFFRGTPGMYQLDSIDTDFIHNTRFSFPASVELDCSPDQLFDIFEDPDSWPVWVSAIQNVEWTSPQPFGIGTTRTVTMIGGLEGYEEFIEWERGKRMAFKFTQSNKNSLTAFGEDYRVTDLGNNRCKLEWTMAMAPRGASKVFMTLLKPLMGWFAQRTLNDLAKYVANHVPAGVRQAT